MNNIKVTIYIVVSIFVIASVIVSLVFILPRKDEDKDAKPAEAQSRYANISAYTSAAQVPAPGMPTLARPFSKVYSSMALNTVDVDDSDLNELVFYIISDISAVYGFHRLKQPNGSADSLEILLFYLENHSPSDKLTYNQQLVSTLPLKYANYKDLTCCSSSVMGNGQIMFMRLMYNEIEPIQRAALVVHEYFHVIQLSKCEVIGQSGMVWLWEGGATALQYMWAEYRLKDSNSTEYKDFVFTQNGAVGWTLNEAQNNSYTFGVDSESYGGTSRNYFAETVAVLYLSKKTSLKKVLHDFIGEGTCKQIFGSHTKAAVDRAFASFSGLWPTLQAFYDEFNSYIRTTVDLSDLKPSSADLAAVFTNSHLCSNLCETSSNGFCDNSCKHGSDCTDCGNTVRTDIPPLRAGCTHNQGQCK